MKTTSFAVEMSLKERSWPKCLVTTGAVETTSLTSEATAAASILNHYLHSLSMQAAVHHRGLMLVKGNLLVLYGCNETHYDG